MKHLNPHQARSPNRMSHVTYFICSSGSAQTCFYNYEGIHTRAESYLQSLQSECFHMRRKVRNLNDHSNCAIWMIIRMTVIWTMCTQNYTAFHNGPDHQLNWTIQIMHRDVILRTHGPKYRHLNYHSNCTFRMIIQITHFCSRVKTVLEHIQKRISQNSCREALWPVNHARQSMLRVCAIGRKEKRVKLSSTSSSNTRGQVIRTINAHPEFSKTRFEHISGSRFVKQNSRNMMLNCFQTQRNQIHLLLSLQTRYFLPSENPLSS